MAKAKDYEDSFAEFTKTEVLDEEEDKEEETEDHEEEDEEVEETQEEESQEEEDPWADASEAQREALRKLEAERDEFRHKAESQSGRVSALQKKLNEVESRQMPQAPRAAAPAAAKQPETDDEKRWKEFKDEYPELAQTMEDRLAWERAQMRNEFSQSMQPIAQRLQNLSGAEYERYVQSQERTLDAIHPDWRDIAKSEKFASWVRALPKNVATLVDSDDASEVAFLIDSYKRTSPQNDGDSEVSEIKRKREERLRSSRELPASRSGGGRPIAKDDFAAAFAAYANRAERSKRG